MRYALMLVGVVLIVGIGAQMAFESMLVQEPEPVPRPTTPFTHKVSRLWAKNSDSRDHIRSNTFWVNEKQRGFGFRGRSNGCLSNCEPVQPRNPFTNR